MSDIILFLQQNAPTTYLVIGALIVFILMFIFEKGKAPFVRLIDRAVVEAEYSFNSGEGKKKLEFALDYIDKNLKTLPIPLSFIVSFLLTKKNVIDSIEKSLNKLSIAFGTGRSVDIKGNETEQSE